MKRLPLFVALVGITLADATSSGCTGAHIGTFRVAPRRFCTIPRLVVVEWRAAGAEITLESTPVGIPRERVAAAGRREVNVDAEAMVFRLRAVDGAELVTREETAARIIGSHPIPLDGRAICVGGSYTVTLVIQPDEFSSEMVVGGITTAAGARVKVRGPDDRETTLPLGGATTALNGTPLTGAWTITVSPIPLPCRGAGAVGGGSAEEEDVHITIEAVCPRAFGFRPERRAVPMPIG
jgi:hypothetical protein